MMNEITDDSLLILCDRRRNKGGRPRVAERKVPVTVFVPPAYYDRITRAASAQGEHVSEHLCSLLVKAFTPRR